MIAVPHPIDHEFNTDLVAWVAHSFESVCEDGVDGAMLLRLAGTALDSRLSSESPQVVRLDLIYGLVILRSQATRELSSTEAAD
jgi:hypothetical protein